MIFWFGFMGSLSSLEANPTVAFSVSQVLTLTFLRYNKLKEHENAFSVATRKIGHDTRESLQWDFTVVQNALTKSVRVIERAA